MTQLLRFQGLWLIGVIGIQPLYPETNTGDLIVEQGGINCEQKAAVLAPGKRMIFG